MTNKEMLEGRLKSWSSIDRYGAFYKGKLLIVGRSNAFVQKGRLKSELIRDSMYLYDFDKKLTVRPSKDEIVSLIDELVACGDLELKLIQDKKPERDPRVGYIEVEEEDENDSL